MNSLDGKRCEIEIGKIRFLGMAMAIVAQNKLAANNTDWGGWRVSCRQSQP